MPAASSLSTVRTRSRRGGPAWLVVAQRELKDLWLAGRGLPLILAFTALLSVTTYLVASNQELNFLEQRESVTLTLQIAVAVGSLLVLIAAADGISGERERGTLESLLLTPAPRSSLTIGKGIAAFSLWAAAWTVSIPYLWYLGRGSKTVTEAVLTGLLVGSLLALFLAGYGLVVSGLVQSNRTSLSVGLFTLFALYAPTQLPTGLQKSWVGSLLWRADPFTAGLRYLSDVVLRGHPPGRDAEWLIGPVVLAIAAPLAAVLLSHRIRLYSGDRP
ncbi:ABC-2 type transport system permease protein [Kribbella orskensis]|uniref:ABC-2 type transport system permease protein n=1 Tax=Kribbella orskensis TaxID=2512216 RepID=A0ABY2BFT5_9ACTN|nr:MULTISPECIES: ABC transporter permease subunit [Kribbella]TCN37654.1 ABC-2 type transport system permease protein [Kribbella sp. VKM Ac-2500]TCO18844.1 ABC-2 type transport system permease protein [Kribbella orskensis]